MKPAPNKMVVVTLIVVLAALGGAFLCAAPSTGNASKKETAFERVMKTRTIRCAYAAWPPYFVIDPNTKAKSGVFFEVMEAIGKTANLKIDWQEDVNYSLIDQTLNGGRTDVFCGLIWTSSGRAQRMEFTSPIAYAPLYVYAREGDRRYDNNVESINDEKTTISVVDGTTNKGVADVEFPRAKRSSLPEMSDGVQMYTDVSAGKADVAIASPDIIYDYNRNNPERKLRRVQSAAPLRLFGEVFGVAKGEWELRDLLNVSIAELHGNGTIERILKKHEKVPDALFRVAKPYVSN
ncbi:MAG: transporter substrate-binding domain-containing protein [Alphaproteobacteria bacterium]|nr:transporter substrate-binding domain-containing protein [Alphaproteobacteria bacterium]